VNILDENIPEHQRQKLKNWRIRVYQIGFDAKIFARKNFCIEMILVEKE